jgi:hypothetical protein
MDNQPTPPEPTDIGGADLQYLDTIEAPVPQPKYHFFRDPTVVKILIISVIAIIITIVAVVIFNSQSNRSPEIVETLSLRYTNLSKTRTDYGSSNMIVNSNLRSASTKLGVYFSDASRGIAPFLPDFDLDPKKPTASISTSETSLITDINEALEDAQVNGRLEREFATIFNSQIAEILTLLSDLDYRSPSAKLHEYILSTRTNFQSLKIELESYLNSH